MPVHTFSDTGQAGPGSIDDWGSEEPTDSQQGEGNEADVQNRNIQQGNRTQINTELKLQRDA